MHKVQQRKGSPQFHFFASSSNGYKNVFHVLGPVRVNMKVLIGPGAIKCLPPHFFTHPLPPSPPHQLHQCAWSSQTTNETGKLVDLMPGKGCQRRGKRARGTLECGMGLQQWPACRQKSSTNRPYMEKVFQKTYTHSYSIDVTIRGAARTATVCIKLAFLCRCILWA